MPKLQSYYSATKHWCSSKCNVKFAAWQYFVPDISLMVVTF